MTIKPQLAEDAILEEVKFPCIVQPKIDGVRALNLTGTLTGRSLKPFEGHGITEYFTYTKVWDGREDNLVLQEIVDATPNLTFTSLMGALETRYAALGK